MEVFPSAVFWVCFMQLTQLSALFTSTKVSPDEERSFTVKASTVGWVGFGFACLAPNKMRDYDLGLIVAGYKKGHGYIYDMFSTGQSSPHVDSSQDYHFVMTTGEEGYTILHFERGANTGDAKDILFMANQEYFFVWALHSSFDATESSTVYPFHERKGSSQFTQLMQTGCANLTRSTESEAISHPATPNPACSMHSVDDLQPRRDSDAHSNPVSETDLGQERVEGIHFRKRKLLSIRSEDSNSNLDESSSQKMPTPVAEDKKRAEQNKGAGSNKGKASEMKWIYLSLLCIFLAELFAMGYYIHWKMNISKIWREISELPDDLSTNVEERIQQLHDRVDALRPSKEKRTLVDKLDKKGSSLCQSLSLQKRKIKIRKIRREMSDIQNNNSMCECQEKIRQLNDQISSMGDPMEKDNLFKELKAVAHQGLTDDLTQILEESELLQEEALNLVLNHLTNVKKLAKYLNETSDEQEELQKAGTVNVSRRLGPYLEVLCKLEAKGIDVLKEWVKNLCRKAPSLHKLSRLGINELRECCKGADRGEINDVFKVILQYTEERSKREQLPSVPHSKTFLPERKAADKQNLAKAQALLNEAEGRAPRNQPEVSEKIAEEVVKTLDLPENWFNQEEIKNLLLGSLIQMTKDCINAVEAAEEYESNVEVIKKASEGRALCGLYHSEYETPQPTDSQLLREPTNVNFANPEKKEDFRCISFCAKGLASNYVDKLTKLSCRANLCASGWNGIPSMKAGAGIQKQSQIFNNFKSCKTSASAVYFSRISQKTFHFDRKEIRLSSACTEDAMRLVQKANDASDDELANDARSFLKRYGSHFPAGTQTLGGFFFTIADVESQSNMDEVTLQKAASNHLEGQMSIRFLSETFGIGGNVSGSKSVKVKHKEENNKMCFSYSKASMGPPANPATFHKLLSYNSNWALIDRGNVEINIPVWELVKDLGGVFEEAARVLKNTWTIDESERKTKWDASKVERERAQETKEAINELQGIKETHLEKEHSYFSDHSVICDKLVFEKTGLRRKEAYDKAIGFISRNPRQHFCQITRVWRKIGNYTLKCWRGLEKPTFGRGKGEHVLFFSEKYFYWKDNLPERG